MSYGANQYNYATPLSSVVSLVAEQPSVVDKKYFMLANNTLDGSYTPISGDVGLWGASVSGTDGTLPTPFVVTVTDNSTINAFRLTGSVHSYPVAFTVRFYNGSSLLYTITETNNGLVQYVHYLPRTLTVTRYEISVTRISAPSTVARLYNVYEPPYIKRTDRLSIGTAHEGTFSGLHQIKLSDTLRIKPRDTANFYNAINRTHDTLVVGCNDTCSFGVPVNVHTRMKEASRRVYGKVYITYTDPMLDSTYHISGSITAYNSAPAQLIDGKHETNRNFFNLYENDLTGRYVVSDASSQVGWVSNALSNASGSFDGQAPYLRIDFTPRPLNNLQITFDDSRGAIPVDFTFKYVNEDGTTTVYEFVDNSDAVVSIEAQTSKVVAVVLEVTRLSKPGYPVVILEMPILFTLEYVGYQDRSDLINIDLLEELTYDDDVEALGGVSANVITVALDNSNKDFNFNNADSIVAASLKSNRKIVPYLGVEVTKGEIEWYTLGTFWSYRWDVPVESLTAKVVGFDTIGLLDKTPFSNHTVQIDKSIGWLLEYVLSDAKRQLPFVSYSIDTALYDIIIPYAWFSNGSHTAALRKISECYPMHIYCDRDGVICAAPQKLHLDDYFDVWSDSTNVISKRYDSLYTTLPNIINVEVKSPVVKEEETLVEDSLAFNVTSVSSRTLNFSNVYVSGIVVSIDCDSTVQYTYSAYSWGLVVNFTGTGTVRSIKCTGAALDISHSATITNRDEESIIANGSSKRDIKSDFIQTADHATMLIDRILSLSEHDKYDVHVEYRGDIALSINDPILLLDGIAPDNRYNIKRHTLFWDGSLSGTADLNT